MSAQKPSHPSFRNETPLPAREVVIDQPPEPESKTVDLKWTVTFELKFVVAHPLTRDEFIQVAREHLDWMRRDIQEKFPPELLQTLDKYQLIRRETFQQNGEPK